MNEAALYFERKRLISKAVELLKKSGNTRRLSALCKAEGLQEELLLIRNQGEGDSMLSPSQQQVLQKIERLISLSNFQAVSNPKMPS